jgi:hypothetical protein
MTHGKRTESFMIMFTKKEKERLREMQEQYNFPSVAALLRFLITNTEIIVRTKLDQDNTSTDVPNSEDRE